MSVIDEGQSTQWHHLDDYRSIITVVSDQYVVLRMPHETFAALRDAFDYGVGALESYCDEDPDWAAFCPNPSCRRGRVEPRETR